MTEAEEIVKKTSTDTCRVFSDFIGTENYYPMSDNKYAYTDAMHYLSQFFDLQDFNLILQKITEWNNWHTCFTMAKMIVKDREIELQISDGGCNNLQTYLFYFPFKGSVGIYKMYCYNFIIMAASEY